MRTSAYPLRVFIVLLGLLFISGPADAQSASAFSPGTSWVITSIAGDAKVRSLDASDVEARAGTQLAEGMTITTGDGGRVVLNRGGDSITVSPNSAFNIGPDNGDASTPNILQTLGTLLFSIDSSAGPRNFKVHTPYLAAVIKGTVFSVSVTPEGSALHVTEGLVQVADLATGQTGLVAVGQTARVSASGGGVNIDRGDGRGNSGEKKEGRNTDTETDTAAGNDNGNGKSDGKGNATSAEARQKKPGLKIKAAIDAGIGNVAENTGGLVSMSTPGRTQANPGDARNSAPGHSGNNVNARGPKLDTIASVKNNATGNGSGNGNAGGNGVGGGNPNVGGGNPNAGGGNPNAGGGNPNAGGGNPNAGGGNPNAGGNNGNGNGNS